MKKEFLTNMGFIYMENVYVSAFVLMVRDQDDAYELMAELGFSPQLIQLHVGLRELAMEFGIDFQDDFMFAETEFLYDFASSDEGLRLAFAQLRGSDAYAISPTQFRALMSGSRHPPGDILFVDWEIGHASRKKRRRVDDSHLGSDPSEADDDIFSGNLSIQSSAKKSNEPTPDERLPSTGSREGSADVRGSGASKDVVDYPKDGDVDGGAVDDDLFVPHEVEAPKGRTSDVGETFEMNIDPSILNDHIHYQSTLPPPTVAGFTDSDHHAVPNDAGEPGSIQKAMEASQSGSTGVAVSAYPPPPRWSELPVPSYVEDFIGPVFPASVHAKVTVYRTRRDSIFDAARAVGDDWEGDAEDLTPQTVTVPIPAGHVLETSSVTPTHIDVPPITIASCSLAALKALFLSFPSGVITGFDGFGLFIVKASGQRELVAHFAGWVDEGILQREWTFYWNQNAPIVLEYVDLKYGNYACELGIAVVGKTREPRDRLSHVFGMEAGLVNVPAWVDRQNADRRLTAVVEPDVKISHGPVAGGDSGIRSKMQPSTTAPTTVTRRTESNALSTDTPMEDLSKLERVQLSREAFFRWSCVGFLYDDVEFRSIHRYKHRIRQTNRGGGTLMELVCASEHDAGKKGFLFRKYHPRLRSWPLMKVMDPEEGRVVKACVNPFFGKTPPTITRALIEETTRICGEIVIAEMDRANTTYCFLTAAQSRRKPRKTTKNVKEKKDKKKKKSKKIKVVGEGVVGSTVPDPAACMKKVEEGEVLATNEKMDDRRGNEDVKGKGKGEPAKLKNGKFSKSGKSNLNKFRHYMRSLSNHVLKDGELESWYSTGFQFARLLNDEREDIRRRTREAIDLYVKGNTMVITGTPEEGEVVVAKGSIETSPSHLIAFGTDRWANIVKAIDPNPDPLPKGRPKKENEDLQWSSEGEDGDSSDSSDDESSSEDESE